MVQSFCFTFNQRFVSLLSYTLASSFATSPSQPPLDERTGPVKDNYADDQQQPRRGLRHGRRWRTIPTKSQKTQVATSLTNAWRQYLLGCLRGSECAACSARFAVPAFVPATL